MANPLSLAELSVQVSVSRAALAGLGRLVSAAGPPPPLAGARLNVALHVFATPVMLTTPSVQSLSPLQPANVEPVVAVAVSVTCVPLANASLQSVPHAMPAGLLDTPPLPVPALATVSDVTGVLTAQASFVYGDWPAPLNARTR